MNGLGNHAPTSGAHFDRPKSSYTKLYKAVLTQINSSSYISRQNLKRLAISHSYIPLSLVSPSVYSPLPLAGRSKMSSIVGASIHSSPFTKWWKCSSPRLIEDLVVKQSTSGIYWNTICMYVRNLLSRHQVRNKICANNSRYCYLWVSLVIKTTEPVWKVSVYVSVSYWYLKYLSGFYIYILLAIEKTEPASMKSKCVRVNSRDEG